MLVTRTFVATRLCISIRATYRLFPATASSMISTSQVLAKLNKSRMNNQPEISGEFIPQLRDTEQLADDLGITPRRVRSWTQTDRRHPCPYFQMLDRDGHETKRLFDPIAIEAWANRSQAK